ncbi:hypothetical protein Dsin_026214 [Dipteronia sinensis]|uniref:Uncharacterized protein n=1 Tax=Dipteronia sinensis TaxID=43782 RepID=A0AAD9ZXR9_9ROSI|nr:hypothetical protein Dsin_026214 [Dipteronia sinensis]
MHLWPWFLLLIIFIYIIVLYIALLVYSFFCAANNVPSISWQIPKTEMIVDFLVFHLHWEPSYIRQMMLPMLSTIYLREMATTQLNALLYEQYEFHSIHRVKIRYGYPSYVVKWKKAAYSVGSYTVPDEECDLHQEELMEANESFDLLDESNNPQIHVVDGRWFLLTDENMELVHSAFPKEVEGFLQDKESRELKRGKISSLRSEGSNKKLEPLKSMGVQLSITEFYRSAKVQNQGKLGEDLAKNVDSQGGGTSKEKRKASSANLSKSTRRRLLF